MKSIKWIATMAFMVCGMANASAVCSWDKPGVNPYMGSIPDAVDRYQDIPKFVREKLKTRMEKRQYDDLAVISRDTIVGKDDTEYVNLRQMHFGPGLVCKDVTRERWPEKSRERGLVYCESGYCIIVPTVCRNVSRIDRIERPLGMSPRAGEPGAGGGFPQAIEFMPHEFAPIPETPLDEPMMKRQSVLIPEDDPLGVGTPGNGSWTGGGVYWPPIFGGGGGGGWLPPGGGTGPYPPGGGTGPFPPGGGNPPVINPPGGGNPPIPAVPEPETWLLMVMGLGMLYWFKRRK